MSGRLRAFVVDDEALALERLAQLLRATHRVDVVGTATDPRRALAALTADPVEVVFLDIRMPGMSGLELAERLPGNPVVVFVTGYDRYAVQAFELNAVDYLMKPVSRARLERTLDRLERLRDDPARGEFRGVMERLAGYLRAGQPACLERVPCRRGERVELVDVARVTHFTSKDRLTFAVTPDTQHVIDQSIAELEEKLDPAKFLKIHRAVLVNLAWVREAHAGFGGGLILRLKDEQGTELVVARDRVGAVKQRLGL
ncbi:MAG: LytR/AlgR family response regulator transcription factor [Candidatus Methylomirabilia bacterium]